MKRLLDFVLGFGIVLGPAPVFLAAQVAPRAGAEAASPEPEADAGLRSARVAQRRFERDRVRWLPVIRSWGGGDCDEVLGRMCLHHREGRDWYPTPEDPSIGEARDELLRALAAAAAHSPDDGWILGQRVFYLGEAGRWEEAAALAAHCMEVERRGWCGALEGLAYHALGRFPEAEQTFRRALARMPAEERARWLDVRPLLGATGRGWWNGLAPGERTTRAALFWTLADPLLLMPGNDRLTEHWARWTVARTRADARNPYGMSWGSDLEELTVRYGWEVGWEREEPRTLNPLTPDAVVGHWHPESRPLLPPAAALEDPARVPPEAWIPSDRWPRTAYAPSFAPVLLPGAAGQLALFPRGDRFVLVGAYALPEDTTYHARHDHPEREVVPPRWRDHPSEAGLFLLPAESPEHEPVSVRRVGREQGALLLDAPAGRWVASLEVLAPSKRRAGRTRAGVDVPPRPRDLASLSDLLLIESGIEAGESIVEVAERALPRLTLAPGELIAFAWELFGLGYRPEQIAYRLTVEEADAGLLRRAGQWLGLLGPARAQQIEWEEPGPERPGPALRGVELEIPEVVPGWYVVRLEVRTAGREPLVRELRVELRD